jgi:hypothetical protein
MTTVRNYRRGEELPECLRTGFETAPGVDPTWIFVAERDGHPTALMVCAPAHAMVIMLRLVSIQDVRWTDIRALMLYARRQIRMRNFAGYCTWIDPTLETERSLMSLIKAAGGTQLMNPQVACAGKV